MASSVVPSYLPMVRRRKNLPYTEAERDWQLIRRGRYVEYNLVYDRGTKFGLVTPQARIESIFISLPLLARWEYKHLPTPGSREEALMTVLKQPKEWVADDKQSNEFVEETEDGKVRIGYFDKDGKLILAEI